MKYKLLAGLVLFFCIIAAFWSDAFTIFLQDKLVARSDYFIVGQARIKPMENWILYFKQAEGGDVGLLYGVIPSNIYKSWSNSVIYNFKISGNDEFLTFIEMDEKEIGKIQHLLETPKIIEKYKKDYPLNGEFYITRMYGWVVLILSTRSNEKTLYIPDLHLKILFPFSYDISKIKISTVK